MKFSKITSVVAGLTVLAATLVPAQVSAAGVSLSLSGATNTSGTFSTIVYEDSGSAHITTAKIDLGFSGAAVSGVSYDYSVGPFSTTTPSGAGVAQGSVVGQQPVARVTFKMASPGAVTTSAGGSYAKGTNDDGTQVITYSVSGGSASFTYNAPATPGGQGGGSTSTGSTGSTGSSSNPTNSAASTKVATNNSPSSNNGSVAAAETKAADTASANKDDKKAKTDNTKKNDVSNTADKKPSKTWLWLLIAAIVAVVAYLATRKNLQARVDAAKSAEEAKGDDTTEVVAPTAATATAGNTVQKKAKGNKKARGNRK